MRPHEKIVLDENTGELKDRNDNFAQFYIDKMQLITEMIRENPNAASIFIWLIQHMDKRNALVVSQQALAEAHNLHRNTIATCTNYLKEKKAVQVLRSGGSTIYAVNVQIVWKTNANKKRYAMFDAAVYVAESEQDAPLYNTELVGHAVIKKKRGRPTKMKSTLLS
jgi:DNA-binding transcriptional regulator YhcF (GntR family)